MIASHHPSSAAPSIPGLSSPLDQLLLTRLRKHHSDLSKTFRLYLNTKREIGRYLGSAATISPAVDGDRWEAHSTHCFLCGRDSVALLMKLLAELPTSCIRGWMAVSTAWQHPSLKQSSWHWHAVLDSLMAGSGYWADDDAQQCGKYLLAVLCNEPSLSTASVLYLTEHVKSTLLYVLWNATGEAAEAEPFIDFLHLLILSQLQQNADTFSAVLVTALTLCIEVLLKAIERFDSLSVAEFVIVPLLRLITRAAQLPNIPASAPPSTAAASALSAAARRSSSPPSVESPALSGEMRSPFFASLSSVGLSSVVMSPSLQPLDFADAASAHSSSHVSPSKLRPPSAVSASSSPRKRASPAFPSLAVPPVGRSPLSSPVPSAALSTNSRSSPLSPQPSQASTNPFASPPTPLPPLQLPAASTSTATAAATEAEQHYVTMSRLQSLLAHLSSFLVQLGVSSSVPPSLVRSPMALAEWHSDLVRGSFTPSSSFVIRHCVDRWRRYVSRKTERESLPYLKLRRLLLNPASDDVQSSTAHLLFLLSSLPAGEEEGPEAAAAETASSSFELMDVDIDEKHTDIVVQDATQTGNVASRTVLSFSELRTRSLLDVQLSILSTLTRDEAQHSSHFFAVFAELLNSSSSVAVNASYKRRCVIRGVLPVIMQRMAEQLTALAEREEVNSSTVLSRCSAVQQRPSRRTRPSACTACRRCSSTCCLCRR